MDAGADGEHVADDLAHHPQASGESWMGGWRFDLGIALPPLHPRAFAPVVAVARSWSRPVRLAEGWTIASPLRGRASWVAWRCLP